MPDAKLTVYLYDVDEADVLDLGCHVNWWAAEAKLANRDPFRCLMNGKWTELPDRHELVESLAGDDNVLTFLADDDPCSQLEFEQHLAANRTVLRGGRPRRDGDEAA